MEKNFSIQATANKHMPWYCYTGLNTLVLWNFVTFALDSTSVLDRGVYLNPMSVPFLLFTLSQAISMGILTCFADTIQKKMFEHTSLHAASWAFAAIIAVGTFAMLSPSVPIMAVGSIGAGCGSAWLWLLWALFFAGLETKRFEDTIVRSVCLSILPAALLALLPATIRFFVAQVIPFISVFCSIRATRWMKDRDGFDEADDTSTPLKPNLRETFGLTLPPFLVFLLIPFLQSQTADVGHDAVAVLIIVGFALAAAFTYLFLRFTPSVDLAFIFRWQVPLIALSLVLYAMGLTPIIALTLLVASLIVISEFIWI